MAQRSIKCRSCEVLLEPENMKTARERDTFTQRIVVRRMCPDCWQDEYACTVECTGCEAYVPDRDMQEVTQSHSSAGKETKMMLCSECRANQCMCCENYFPEDLLGECDACDRAPVCGECENFQMCCKQAPY